MTRSRRWAGCAAVGALVAAAAVLPVAARPVREERPPLVVSVARGESLWTLAREHADPSRDVREVVAEIMRVNAVDPGKLQPGTEITIPAKYLPAKHLPAKYLR